MKTKDKYRFHATAMFFFYIKKTSQKSHIFQISITMYHSITLC